MEPALEPAPPPAWLRRSLLALLFGAGALLRLWDLGSMEFKGDEQAALQLGLDLLAARPWATDAAWPAHGMMSSGGIANAPLFNWVMALFWAVAGSPKCAAVLVGLANTLALGPLYLWARRRTDEGRALLILGTVALSPLAVIYSRKLWAQDLLFPGIVFLLWGLEWLRGSRPWRGLGVVILACLPVSQLHQSGPITVLLLPLAAGMEALLHWRKGNRPRAWGRPSTPELGLIALALVLNLFFLLPHLRYLLSLPPGTFARRPQLPELGLGVLARLFSQAVPLDLFYFFAPEQQAFFSEGQAGAWLRGLRVSGWR